jgi:hypothetical protein
MGKRIERLTDLKCKNAKPAVRPDGTVAKTTLLPDGGNLYLQISDTGSKSWIFRSAVGGCETRIGLGAYPQTSLIEARKLADQHRAAARSGANPLDAKRQREAGEERVRREKAAAEALANARGVTFEHAAEHYIAGKKAGWSNAAYREQWGQSLRDDVFPTLGGVSCADIDAEMVLRVLEPNWTTRTKTMSDVRGRIAKILNFAAVKGYRPKGPNPAAWKDNLEVSLASPNKVRPVENRPALPYADVPAFMARLRRDDSAGNNQGKVVRGRGPSCGWRNRAAVAQPRCGQSGSVFQARARGCT